MYQRFSTAEDYSKFDYIIIGSGIGGLCTAVFLAKAGKKVLVLERHYVPGGFSHTFKRKDGFVWDVGVHYVGNMDDQESFLRKIFNYLTDNHLKWESMGDVYDEINIGKEKYLFISGKEKLQQQLYEYFPNDRKAIDEYFIKIKKAASSGSLFFLQKSFPKILQYTIGWIFTRLFHRYSSQTTYEVLRKLTDNEKLISVLCSQCGNYGLPPHKSSFAAHALVTNHFLDGGYYPVGGADQIYKQLLETLFRNSGELRIKAEVENIVIEKGNVKGIKVNGHFIACKNIISNAGAQNTFSKLINKNIQPAWTSKLNKVNPSTGHLCLYVGLDQSDAELNLPRNNVWFYEDYNFDEILEKHSVNAPLRFAYISFPSAKDPSWNDRKPNTATMQAIGPANYKWFEEFENETWMKRGDVYDEIKKAFKEKMLARLYELFPQIKGHVICTEVSTPLSTRHFTNYQHGEIYGLEHSPERFNLKSLLPKSSIKGLYLVGQDIVTVGVGGALASSLLCATSILKFDMAKQFKAIAKFGHRG
jgi:all-trans-retinol 13,14-reductase